MLSTSSMRFKEYLTGAKYGYGFNARWRRFLNALGFVPTLLRLQLLRIFGRENLELYDRDIYARFVRGALSARQFFECLSLAKLFNPFKWFEAVLALGFSIVTGTIKFAMMMADLALSLLVQPIRFAIWSCKKVADFIGEGDGWRAFWTALLLIGLFLICLPLIPLILVVSVLSAMAWLTRLAMPAVTEGVLMAVSFVREVVEALVNTVTSPYNAVIKPLIDLVIKYPLHALGLVMAGLLGVGLLMAGVFLTGGALAPALVFLKPFVAMMSPLVNSLAASVGMAAAKGMMAALVVTVPLFVGNLVRAVVHAGQRLKSNLGLVRHHRGKDADDQFTGAFLKSDTVAYRNGYGGELTANPFVLDEEAASEVTAQRIAGIKAHDATASKDKTIGREEEMVDFAEAAGNPVPNAKSANPWSMELFGAHRLAKSGPLSAVRPVQDTFDDFSTPVVLQRLSLPGRFERLHFFRAAKPSDVRGDNVTEAETGLLGATGGLARTEAPRSL